MRKTIPNERRRKTLEEMGVKQGDIITEWYHGLQVTKFIVCDILQEDRTPRMSLGPIVVLYVLWSKTLTGMDNPNHFQWHGEVQGSLIHVEKSYIEQLLWREGVNTSNEEWASSVTYSLVWKVDED